MGDTVIIITASVPLNPNLTTDTDTVVTDMAVTDTMVNFAQTDQVTRISNPKIRPEQKKIISLQNSLLFLSPVSQKELNKKCVNPLKKKKKKKKKPKTNAKKKKKKKKS